jgi:hypothetical protein
MNQAEQNIVKTLQGKTLLFVENDNGLYHGLDRFKHLLKRNGIEYKILFEVGKKPLDKVLKAIQKHDGIIFQTQWVYEVSTKLKEYMFSLKDPKIVIEVPVGDPTWYFKPAGVPHDVYIFKTDEMSKEDEFYKLREDKAYWNYENGFDD